VEFGINGDANIAASRILVPVAIATVLPGVSFGGGGGGGGGTIATVLSPVPISGTVAASPPNYIGTLASMGTVGTVQSLPNMAVASLVGSVGALPNMAVASLVGSIGSPVAVGGGTMGTVQSQANLAAASLVGSLGSPVAIAGGTIGTIQSGVTDIGTIYGGMAVDPLFGPQDYFVSTVGLASMVLTAKSYFSLPGQPNNHRVFNVTAAAFGGAGTVTILAGGSQILQMVVPQNDTRMWECSRGLALGGGFFSTLFATIAGTMYVSIHAA